MDVVHPNSNYVSLLYLRGLRVAGHGCVFFVMNGTTMKHLEITSYFYRRSLSSFTVSVTQPQLSLANI